MHNHSHRLASVTHVWSTSVRITQCKCVTQPDELVALSCNPKNLSHSTLTSCTIEPDRHHHHHFLWQTSIDHASKKEPIHGSTSRCLRVDHWWYDYKTLKNKPPPGYPWEVPMRSSQQSPPPRSLIRNIRKKKRIIPTKVTFSDNVLRSNSLELHTRRGFRHLNSMILRCGSISSSLMKG